MKRNFLKQYLPATLGIVVSLLLFSCEKSKIEAVEIYPAPPSQLVKFLDGAPSPAIGNEGSIITFNVNGLKGKEGQFKFFINQVEAPIVSVEENTIRVKVPANASTGGSSVLINGEYYFGPTFNVRGKVSIDPLFNGDSYRANAGIEGIFKRAGGTSLMIYGSFTDYQTQASVTNTITGMAVLGLNAEYAPLTAQMKVGKLGINGPLSQVIERPDGKFLVAGQFSKHDTVDNISNITRLNVDGSLETMVVDVINPDPVNTPNADKDVVPAFNGGSLGGISRAFYNSTTGMTTIVGNFVGHVSTFYERSTITGPFLDLVQARQIIRMKETGEFDSSFNFNRATNKGYDGGNGFIFDALQLPNGNTLVVGNFTSFSGKTVNYLVSIRATDGLVDETFNSGGAGADGTIYKARYNSATGKILLTGEFKNYNGAPANGVVMIGTNGARDNSFSFRNIDGGIVNFAGQLNNGKIIASGTFNKYDNIVRPGLVVLNADGSLAAGYNNTGLFRGFIRDFVEVTSSNGVPGVILVGLFDRFDNTPVGNIVKFRIEN